VYNCSLYEFNNAREKCGVAYLTNALLWHGFFGSRQSRRLVAWHGVVIITAVRGCFSPISRTARLTLKGDREKTTSTGSECWVAPEPVVPCSGPLTNVMWLAAFNGNWPRSNVVHFIPPSLKHDAAYRCYWTTMLTISFLPFFFFIW